MQTFILINSIIYLALGIWCAIKPVELAQSIGFAISDSKGTAEFVAVYGGLEFAVGILSLLLYFNSDLYRNGIILFAILYGCIASFRLSSLIRFGSEINIGWYFFSFEILFFIISLVLLKN